MHTYDSFDTTMHCLSLFLANPNIGLKEQTSHNLLKMGQPEAMFPYFILGLF